MTTFDYSRPLATANRLIARFGQLGAIRRPGDKISGPDYNPTFGDPTNDPARFAIVPIDAKQVDGTRILTTDMTAYVSPGSLPSAPGLTDKLVEADGSAWEIIQVNTLRPATMTLLYTLVVRQ